MTDKRFILAFEDFDGWAILDTTGEYSNDEDYIDWLSGQKAVDVMNHFAEENEQLKTKNFAYLQDIEVFKEENTHLKLENEQLKQTCQRVEDTYHFLQKKFHNWDIALSKCREENEQLKKDIQDKEEIIELYQGFCGNGDVE